MARVILKALLLSGYRTNDDFLGQPLGTAPTRHGLSMLEQQIRDLKTVGLDVCCVLAGADADEQLRRCPSITRTELVFDASASPTLTSNARAGLAAAKSEGCFVIPVEIAAPPVMMWKYLTQAWRQIGVDTQFSIVQATDAQGAPWHFGFPVVITPKGNQLIRELTDLRGLADPRLTYHRAVVSDDSLLALAAKAA